MLVVVLAMVVWLMVLIQREEIYGVGGVAIMILGYSIMRVRWL